MFIGLATVGRLDRRFARERIIAWSFVFGGVSLLAVSLFLDRWTVLMASFAIGLSFAWKKIPVDTMVQEAVPDGLRGRVFAVYDVAYNLSRLLAAVLAIVLLPTIGENGSAALIGIVFLLWAPVLPRWIRGVPEIRLRFHEGARAEEWPRAVRLGRRRGAGRGRPLGARRTRRRHASAPSGCRSPTARRSTSASESPTAVWAIDRELVE